MMSIKDIKGASFPPLVITLKRFKWALGKALERSREVKQQALLLDNIYPMSM